MQELVREYLNELGKKQKKRRRINAIVAAFAVVIVGGVIWALVQSGIAMTGDPMCGKEEHTHTAECYSDVLVCGQEESVGHQHTETCYQTTQTLICGQEESEPTEESEGHTHDAECYAEEQTLVCGQEESAGHQHTEACYEKQLTCGKEEHTHTDECFIDTNADVEDAAQWDAEYQNTEWKETWGENLVIAAEKQIGNKESSKNYTAAEDGSHKGYTRYGQFMGDVYADWDAAFVNFCLHYAGLEETQMFPKEVKTSDWYEKFVTAAERNYKVCLTTPDGYEPQAGDIIFLKKENEETETQMGIVSSYNKEENEIKVIEGNSGNEVKENKYSTDDKHIIEYLKIAEMEEAYKGSKEVPEENGTDETNITDTIEATEAEEIQESRIMEAEGPDYKVTVSFTGEAGIPEEAELKVREIEQGSAEYQQYYEQSLKAAETDDFRFARYFDITFLVNGEKIEPTAPVDVKISYLDDMAIDDGSNGTVIHFAADGTEVLDTEVDSEEKSFSFTQSSFSVTGTVTSDESVLYYETNVGTSEELDGEEFLITNNSSSNLILSSNQKGVKGVEFDGESTVLTTATAWEFEKDGDSSYKLYDSKNNQYLSLEEGELTTSDSGTAFTVQTSDGKIQLSAVDDEYVASYANQTSAGWETEEQAESLTLYTADQARAAYQYVVLNPYNVSKTGNSGLAYDFVLDNKRHSNDRLMIRVTDQDNTGRAEVTLPDDTARKNGFRVSGSDTTQHTIKEYSGSYQWRLAGWYNLADKKYYDVTTGSKTIEIDLNEANVFYANWVAADLDNGGATNVLGGIKQDVVSTKRFAKIEMFDYNELFNLEQVGVTQNGVTSEQWDYINNDNDPFTFYSTESWHKGNSSDLAGIGDRTNFAKGKISSEDDARLKKLFTPKDKNNFEDGVRYLGEADKLFSYNESTGTYSYHSDENAAFYNQSTGEFCVYNQPAAFVYTNKPRETIFLPLNQPANTVYEESWSQYTGNHKYGKANYWFGMKVELNFWLPDDAGAEGANRNNDANMQFNFSGDDDLLVFIDGKLVLDLSGIHAKETGTIDFTTGKVTERGQTKDLVTEAGKAGAHVMNIYYLERGRGGSNCNIDFNFYPTWNYKGEANQAVTVDKKWEDSKGNEITTNDSISVELSANGKVEDTQTLNGKLNEGTNTYSWKYLDAGRTYDVNEVVTDNISKSYYMDKSTPKEETKYGYWIEDSNLKDGDHIFIGNLGDSPKGVNKTIIGSVLSVNEEGNNITSKEAKFADDSGVLQEDPLPQNSSEDARRWIVHIVKDSEMQRVAGAGDEEDLKGQLQFRLENEKFRGYYLTIRNGSIQFMQGENQASTFLFSAKGNLTGTSTNRLVCKTLGDKVTQGFEVVSKPETGSDGVDGRTGKGSYRRVHIYRYDPEAGKHTKYTIINKRIEADIAFEKVNKNDSENTKLSGAVFQLCTNSDGTGEVGKPVTSDKNGKISLNSPLGVGTYYLKEIKAPEGYQLLEQPIKINVSKNESPDKGKEAEGIVEVDFQMADWNSTDHTLRDGTIQIPNTMLYKLPETGGSGIHWYMLSGILLMAGAAFITYKKRCREVLKS